MKLTHLILASLGSTAFLALAPLNAQPTGTITQWNFDNLTAASNTSPATSTGTGTATSMGMVNSFTSSGPGNTSDASDITTGSPAPDTGNVWRIRGTNGWNSAAPIATQGASFMMSTAGFSNLSFSFDVDVTAQGEANFAVLYTTNGGTTWTDLPAADFTKLGSGVTGTGSMLAETNTSNANIITGGYLSANGQAVGNTDTWFQDITANLSGITGANNDAGFGIEIVNAATGTANTALKTSSGNNVEINNTSGNWRFDNVTLTGEAVPEPSSWILGLGAVALFAALRVRRQSARR